MTFEIDSDTEISAVFELREYPLSINIEGSGSVNETIVEESALQDYEHGTVVELTAEPEEGWGFSHWEGDIDGDANPQTITVDEEKNVTAIFELKEYSISVTMDGDGSYTLTPEQDTYHFGDEVSVEINPTDGWHFVHWDEDADGTDQPLTLTVEGDISLTAVLDDGPFAGGNGSEEFPYEVDSVEQLQEIRHFTKDHFILIQDIDASETVNWNGGDGFIPIGDDILPFEGSFDGASFQIKSLFINHGISETGLFGQSENAVFRNVHLEDIHIASASVRTGGLVGFLIDGLVENCHVTGLMEEVSLNSGGLVGQTSHETEIRNSSAEIEIFSSGQAGGLIGSIGPRSIVSNSKATGVVKGRSSFSSNLGGLAGINYGDIEKSYATVSVEGDDTIGGLVGQHRSSGTIINSYASSTVTGNNEVGGLVGLVRDNAEIRLSFSTSTVDGNDDVGGFVGLNGNEIFTSYWNEDESSQSSGVGRGSSSGLTGLNTSEMQGTTAQDNMDAFDWNSIWSTTSDYPVLQWQNN